MFILPCTTFLHKMSPPLLWTVTFSPWKKNYLENILSILGTQKNNGTITWLDTSKVLNMDIIDPIVSYMKLAKSDKTCLTDIYTLWCDHSFWKKSLHVSDNHEKLIKLIVVIACDKSMVKVELSCMVSEKCTQDMNLNLAYKHKNVQIL